MSHGTRNGTERWARVGLVALALAVLALGFLGTRWFETLTDGAHRARLLAQAVAVARTVDPQLVQALSFSEADRGKPEFERLRGQMRAYARAAGVRSLYTMALRDGDLVFGPESLDEDDPFASAPGTVYEEPSAQDFGLFRTATPLTQGPEQDEYGTFVSALAPVLDPLTGEVILAVGIDVEAAAWKAAVSRARRAPILVTLFLLAVLLAGVAAQGWRKRLAVERRGRLLYLEAALCASVGLVLALAAGRAAHEAERTTRQSSFSALARVQSAGMLEAFRELRCRLEDLARFFEGSDHVDREEFRVYAQGFETQGLAEDWFWVSMEPDPGGKVFYPLRYHVSPAGREAPGGYDLGEEPRSRAALGKASAARLAVASDPVPDSPLGSAPESIHVFRPVSGKRQTGFAGVSLNAADLITRSLRRSGMTEPGVSAGLFLIDRDQAPLFLGGTDPGHAGHGCWEEDFGGLSDRVPVFLFGRAYGLVVHPTPAWFAAHPLKRGRNVAAAGLIITALLTTLVAFVSNRRAFLESQVLARTGSLLESQERFRLLVENAPVAIFVQTDRRFAYLNPEALRLFGADSAGDLLGRPVLERFHPDVHEIVRERIRRLNEEGSAVPMLEEVYLRLDGTPFDVEVSAVPIVYEGRNGALVYFRDITGHKALEDQLRQAQKMESVGRLAGGVAHDFNNMLAVIIGYSETALMQIHPGHPLYPSLQQIHQAGQRSADLTRQLLAFARRQTVQPRVLDLNDAVAGTLKMLRRLLGEDLELVWKPGADLWHVEMDPSQVDQILANLSVNSRDAIQGVGTVTIETTNVTLDETYSRTHAGFVAGDFVLLTVSDTGCGMDKKTLEHLFEPFFTTKEMGKGTGLGLATVYGIVKQNGGFLNVYSEPGLGTTFRIYLPRALAQSAGVAARAVAREPAGGAETLLLVEDEQAILDVGREILERFGYQVLLAGSPGQALALAESHPGPIHLLLTDMVMPEMNGKELRERIDRLRPGIKTLFMSGHTNEWVTRHDLLGPDVHFLQKPFSVHSLAARVRETLDREGGAGCAPSPAP